MFIDSLTTFHSSPVEGKMLYYCKNSYLWKYNITTRAKTKVASVPFDCTPILLAKDEFFLKDSYNNLYYLGCKKIGKPFKKQRIEFKPYKICDSPSNHLSVGSYRNEQNNIDLYFTNHYETNNFFTFTFSPGKMDSSDDVFVDRGLHGYELRKPDDKMDSGMFFADIDNDGDMDAVCTALRGKSLLYENIGDDRFIDITEEMNFDLKGLINSVWWGDLNRDGLLDIVTSDQMGQVFILLNQGYFRFKEITQKTNIPNTLKNYNTALADMDNDGDLDLFLFSFYDPICYFENKETRPASKAPLFVDISEQSPQLTTRFDFFTQSMSFGDYDNDGDLDLFLAKGYHP